MYSADNVRKISLTCEQVKQINDYWVRLNYSERMRFVNPYLGQNHYPQVYLIGVVDKSLEVPSNKNPVIYRESLASKIAESHGFIPVPPYITANLIVYEIANKVGLSLPKLNQSEIPDFSFEQSIKTLNEITMVLQNADVLMHLAVPASMAHLGEKTFGSTYEIIQKSIIDDVKRYMSFFSPNQATLHSLIHVRAILDERKEQKVKGGLIVASGAIETNYAHAFIALKDQMQHQSPNAINLETLIDRMLNMHTPNSGRGLLIDTSSPKPTLVFYIENKQGETSPQDVAFANAYFFLIQQMPKLKDELKVKVVMANPNSDKQNTFPRGGGFVIANYNNTITPKQIKSLNNI